MTMIDTVTMFGIDQREYEQTVADYAYAMGCDVAVRMARERGIEPRYRPELVELEKAGEVYRKAHEEACAKAAGAKVVKQSRKPRPVTEAKRALKAGLPVKSYTTADGVTINLGESDNKVVSADNEAEAWIRKHVH